MFFLVIFIFRLYFKFFFSASGSKPLESTSGPNGGNRGQGNIMTKCAFKCNIYVKCASGEFRL